MRTLATCQPALAAEVSAQWKLAMQRGDFEAAWRETDRIELPRRMAQRHPAFRREACHLVWDGQPFSGKRVLVRCEHGLGDTLQFVRFCASLRRLSDRILLKVQPSLITLLTGSEGIDCIFDAWTDRPDPPHDVAIECMELAYALRIAEKDLPGPIPYLPVHRIQKTARPLLLHAPGCLKIGLIWAASDWDPSRSVDLRMLAPFGNLPRCKFYALQQGRETAQLGISPFPIEPLSSSTRRVIDAAAAMLEMDLIITVDGMTAHLAGALGRPVWVLLKHESDWRWMTDRQDSPWYPTMRLFRQPSPGDWLGTIQAVAQQLARFAAPKGSGA